MFAFLPSNFEIEEQRIQLDKALLRFQLDKATSDQDIVYLKAFSFTFSQHCLILSRDVKATGSSVVLTSWLYVPERLSALVVGVAPSVDLQKLAL